MRQAWFSCLGAEEKNKAWASFEHVFKEYQKDVPIPADTPAISSASAEQSSFLDSLSAAVDFAGEQGSAPVRSELDHWKDGEGGKGDTYYPLIWWKVSPSSHSAIESILTPCHLL